MNSTFIYRFKETVGTYMEATNTIGILLFSVLMAIAIIIVLEVSPNR